MRKHLLAAAAALALLPAAAFAQDATPATVDPATDPALTPVAPATPDTGAVLPMTDDAAAGGIATAASLSAEELIGSSIVDGEGSSVGSISDLRLADDGKTVSHVMVDVGGFLGIGARTVAIEPSQLMIAEGDSGELVTSMTKEQLEAMPEYEKRDGVWQIRS